MGFSFIPPFQRVTSFRDQMTDYVGSWKPPIEEVSTRYIFLITVVPLDALHVSFRYSSVVVVAVFVVSLAGYFLVTPPSSGGVRTSLGFHFPTEVPPVHPVRRPISVRKWMPYGGAAFDTPVPGFLSPTGPGKRPGTLPGGSPHFRRSSVVLHGTLFCPFLSFFVLFLPLGKDFVNTPRNGPEVRVFLVIVQPQSVASLGKLRFRS